MKNNLNYMELLKKALKSKTIWVSLATICTGIGMFVSGEQNLQSLIVVVVGAGMAALRFLTDSSIKDK